MTWAGPDLTLTRPCRPDLSVCDREVPESPSGARGAAQRRQQSASLKVEGGSVTVLLKKKGEFRTQPSCSNEDRTATRTFCARRTAALLALPPFVVLGAGVWVRVLQIGAMANNVSY